VPGKMWRRVCGFRGTHQCATVPTPGNTIRHLFAYTEGRAQAVYRTCLKFNIVTPVWNC
jgi:hypothetical protein